MSFWGTSERVFFFFFFAFFFFFFTFAAPARRRTRQPWASTSLPPSTPAPAGPSRGRSGRSRRYILSTDDSSSADEDSVIVEISPPFPAVGLSDDTRVAVGSVSSTIHLDDDSTLSSYSWVEGFDIEPEPEWIVGQYRGQHISNITSSSMIVTPNTVLETSTGIAPSEVEHDVDEVEATTTRQETMKGVAVAISSTSTTTTLAPELIGPDVTAFSSLSASSSVTDAPSVVELVTTEEIPTIISVEAPEEVELSMDDGGGFDADVDEEEEHIQNISRGRTRGRGRGSSSQSSSSFRGRRGRTTTTTTTPSPSASFAESPEDSDVGESPDVFPSHINLVGEAPEYVTESDDFRRISRWVSCLPRSGRSLYERALRSAISPEAISGGTIGIAFGNGEFEMGPVGISLDRTTRDLTGDLRRLERLARDTNNWSD